MTGMVSMLQADLPVGSYLGATREEVLFGGRQNLNLWVWWMMT